MQRVLLKEVKECSTMGLNWTNSLVKALKSSQMQTGGNATGEVVLVTANDGEKERNDAGNMADSGT